MKTLAYTFSFQHARDFTSLFQSTSIITRHQTKKFHHMLTPTFIAVRAPDHAEICGQSRGVADRVFDNLWSGITKDRSQFYKNLAVSFSGANRPGALTGHVGSILGSQDAYENIKAFETSRRSMFRPWSPHTSQRL